MLGAIDPTSIDDQAMKKATRDMLESMGTTSKTDSLFSNKILQAYGIEDTVETPSKDRDTWAEFVADLIFRIPPYLIGLTHTGSKTYLYEFAATNPYPEWPLGYGKANHALSDIFLFNPAEDLVGAKHREEYSGAVQQLQREWIDFCYGDLTWTPFPPGNSNEGLGPVYSFANCGAGGESASLAQVVGDEVVERWKTVLEVAER